MSASGQLERREPRAPIPSAGELVSKPAWWLALPLVGLVVGAAVGTVRSGGHPYVWMAAGVAVGLAVLWLGPLALGGYRRARIGGALRATKRAGTVGFVEWHRRRGGPDAPFLMIADAPSRPVLWCVPLLRRPHLPSGVVPIRIFGGLRRRGWVVAFHGDRALWPVGPLRRRPLWTSERVLGPLPGGAPEVPRPVRTEADMPADTVWQPVRLSVKRTAGQVAVVAFELYTGRVLDSGFLPRGVLQGRAPEQNGLYALTPDRRSLLYGSGWSAVAVLGDQGTQAIPVRRLGLVR